MTASKIFTAWDARCEKRDAELPSLARAEALTQEQARIDHILQHFPEIGVLQRGNQKVYYAYLDGYDYAPVEALDPSDLVR